MAIAGSGGWVPSRAVWLTWDRKLAYAQIVTNKPREFVCMSTHEAADILLTSSSTKLLEVHAVDGFIPELRDLLKTKETIL